MAQPVFPLDPGGAAEGMAACLGGHDGLAIVDLTPRPRWGLKGPGSADWFARQGFALPPINRHAAVGGMTMLRLGANDVTLLAPSGDASVLAPVRTGWAQDTLPRGYESWRQENWAWFELSGDRLEGVLAQLTAVDLRPGRFLDNDVAQTRFALVDAVLFRQGAALHVMFDITATGVVLWRVAQASRSAPYGSERIDR